MRNHSMFCLVILAMTILAVVEEGRAADFDEDSVDDLVDNCLFTPNPSQMDTGGVNTVAPDGIGDSCQCGNVLDGGSTGVVNILDVVVIARALASLPPQWASPQLCNTVGPPTPGSGDPNQVPNDCQPDDLTVIREALAATGPGIGEACAVECMPCMLMKEATNLLCRELDIVAGDQKLQEILNITGPTVYGEIFQTAKAFRAFTRVARPILEQDPNVPGGFSELLDALGFGDSARDPAAWFAHSVAVDPNDLPIDPNGACTPPAGSTEEDVEQAIRTELLGPIGQSLNDLDPNSPNPVSPNWKGFCDVDTFFFAGQVEMDYSDILLLRAHLHALRAAIQLMTTYDLDFDIGEACQTSNSGIIPFVEEVLDDYPDLLKLSGDPNAAQAAAGDLEAAVALFEQTLDAFLAETDDQTDDLISIDPNSFTPQDEARLRGQIAGLQASFDAPAIIDPNLAAAFCGDPNTHIGAFFEGPGGQGTDVRGLLPPFVGDDPVVDELPDPTLGGAFPGQTLADLRCTVDRAPPLFQLVPPALQGSTTPNPWSATLYFVDAPLGASPGHAVDPNVAVFMSVYPISGGSCTASIDGAPVTPAGGWNDVTPLFNKTQNPDGSVVLEGVLDISTSGVRGCWVIVEGSAADQFGNDGMEYYWIQLITEGAIAEFSPAPNEDVGSPFDLEIELTAPFGDVDLETLAVSMSASWPDCGEVWVNGVSAGTNPYGLDITSLLNQTSVPGSDPRVLSGSLAVTGSCYLEIKADVLPSLGMYAPYWVEP